MKAAIVTGSGGLIGSAASKFLLNKGFVVYGVDNDIRKYFFGESATTKLTQDKLEAENQNFLRITRDIREYNDIVEIFNHADSNGNNIEIVIHAAAQPSHDWAAKEPLTDFTVNALGTMNMLEATRLHAPKATFIFTVLTRKTRRHHAGPLCGSSSRCALRRTGPRARSHHGRRRPGTPPANTAPDARRRRNPRTRA